MECGRIEEQLPGFVSTVVRVGDEVRRPVSPATPAVHALLVHLERVGFAGAPRFRGIDGRGRARLTYIEGETYPAATPETLPELSLVAIGRLIRRFHDATAGFVLPEGVAWAHAAEREVPGEHVVCHNDISPRNIVFRNGAPVALIDWDLASPAPRAWDVAHVVWQCVPTIAEAHFSLNGWAGVPPLDVRLQRMRTLVNAYGLTAAEREGFADLIALRIARTASGIRALARQGGDVFKRMVEDGTVAQIEADREWVVAHREQIDRAIVVPEDDHVDG